MIDLRLYELLSTLSEAKLDWLATEIMQLIVEAEAVDLIAEEYHGDDVQDKQDAYGDALFTMNVPLGGNEQLLWAADYITKRLEQTLLMTKDSLNNIDHLIFNGDVSIPEEAIQLVMSIGEDRASTVTKTNTESALKDINSLKKNLADWVSRKTDD